MSIFLTEADRVIVQGMTGSEGRKHTARMLSAGRNIGLRQQRYHHSASKRHFGGTAFFHQP